MPIELNIIASLILILIHLCVWWISKWAILPVMCYFNPKPSVLSFWIMQDIHKVVLILICLAFIGSLDWRF